MIGIFKLPEIDSKFAFSFKKKMARCKTFPENREINEK